MLDEQRFKRKQTMKNTGFTLVELLIVISIVSILVALALPNYRESVSKGRRADAQADLIKFSADAERIFTLTSSYITVDDSTEENPGIVPGSTVYYVYSFPVAATAATYIIRATPTSIQSADGCGTMNLTHLGVKTYTGSRTGCWK